jgi:hypothetical protein
MSNNRKKLVVSGVGSGVGTGGGYSVGSGESVPMARRDDGVRKKYDKGGHQLVKLGVLFRRDLYEQYRRQAFFRKVNTYDLINEALEACLPELKKASRQKLVEAGQEELDLV